MAQCRLIIDKNHQNATYQNETFCANDSELSNQETHTRRNNKQNERLGEMFTESCHNPATDT